MTFRFSSLDPSRSRPYPQPVGVIRRRGPPSHRVRSHMAKQLYANEELLLGRDSKRCQFVLDDPSISNKHLRIYSVIFEQCNPSEIPPLVYAEDLSRNGTFWNGTYMGVGNGGFLLTHGDVLRLSPELELEFASDDLQDGEPLDAGARRDAATFNDSYIITDRKLGSGAYGQVYMAVNQFTHRQVACKVVSLKKLKDEYRENAPLKYPFSRWNRPSPAQKISSGLQSRLAKVWVNKHKHETALNEKLKRYNREVEILESLNHPNIIRVEKVFKSEDRIFMFQELVTGGDLFSFIECRNGKLLDIEAAVIIRQILIAVKYLHDHDIVHRDLKPDNVLMSSLTNGSRVVLTDFGCARVIKDEQKRMMTKIGTREYTAPEVMGTNKTLGLVKGYTKAVDMWAMGCMTVVVLTGGSMFHDPETNQYSDRLANECDLAHLDDDPDWRDVGERPKDFVRGVMVLDERKRMTVEEALQHSWFTNEYHKDDFDQVYSRAVKGWKPKMIFGSVVDGLEQESDTKQSNTVTRLGPKKRRKTAIPSTPIEPPYKPAPRIFNQTFYPRSRPLSSVHMYLAKFGEPPSGRKRSRSLPLPRSSAALHGVDQNTLARPGDNSVISPQSHNSSVNALAGRGETRKLTLELSKHPAILAFNDEALLAGVEEHTSADEEAAERPRIPDNTPKRRVLRENTSKANLKWPFSPGAWRGNKEDGSSQGDRDRESTPLTSMLRASQDPGSVNKVGLSLWPTTPFPLRDQSNVPETPRNEAFSSDEIQETTDDISAQTPTPVRFRTHALKRVPFQLKSKSTPNSKKRRGGSVFDLEEDEPATRKRSPSIFDFAEDEDLEVTKSVFTGVNAVVSTVPPASDQEDTSQRNTKLLVAKDQRYTSTVVPEKRNAGGWQTALAYGKRTKDTTTQFGMDGAAEDDLQARGNLVEVLRGAMEPSEVVGPDSDSESDIEHEEFETRGIDPRKCGLTPQYDQWILEFIDLGNASFIGWEMIHLMTIEMTSLATRMARLSPLSQDRGYHDVLSRHYVGLIARAMGRQGQKLRDEIDYWLGEGEPLSEDEAQPVSLEVLINKHLENDESEWMDIDSLCEQVIAERVRFCTALLLSDAWSRLSSVREAVQRENAWIPSQILPVEDWGLPSWISWQIYMVPFLERARETQEGFEDWMTKIRIVQMEQGNLDMEDDIDLEELESD